MSVKKFAATVCGVAMAAGVAVAPNAVATPKGPLPENAIISGVDSTIHPGSSFEVRVTDKATGDPIANTEISFKVDDGKGYGASAAHGRGVVGVATTNDEGYATFTFTDCDFAFTADSTVANGQHWLRGLAKKADGSKLSAKGGSFTFDSSPVDSCVNPGGLG